MAQSFFFRAGPHNLLGLANHQIHLWFLNVMGDWKWIAELSVPIRCTKTFPGLSLCSNRAVVWWCPSRKLQPVSENLSTDFTWIAVFFKAPTLCFPDGCSFNIFPLLVSSSAFISQFDLFSGLDNCIYCLFFLQSTIVIISFTWKMVSFEQPCIWHNVKMN